MLALKMVRHSARVESRPIGRPETGCLCGEKPARSV